MMDFLPIFTQLTGKKVLIVGGGEIALRKIRLLHSAGATIHLIAQQLHPTLQEWINQQKIIYDGEHFSPTMVKEMYLVFAATNNSTLNAAVKVAADAEYKWVNVVDDPSLCQFIMPSIIDRSPLMIAISSGGSSPVLTRLLRERIEQVIPFFWGNIAKLMAQFRPRVKQLIPDANARRYFFEKLLQGHLPHLVETQKMDAATQYVEQALTTFTPHTGEVVLVGAGPGDPGLLTLKALQALQMADVVLHDELVSEEIIALVRRDAELIPVGKRANSHQVAQEITNQWLIQHALAGKRVVRLKGGDGFIFARGGEELAALKAHNIPFRVIPGITAALGAAAYAGIPLTHRLHSQSIIFVTGHCHTEHNAPDWQSLALSKQTLVIYMGTLQATHIQQQLLTHGRNEDTPVAIISHATTPRQHTQITTLKTLATLAKNVEKPALMIIGEVVHFADSLAWFGQLSIHATHHPTPS